MENHDKNSQLESRIEELEYRISILERFIDSQTILYGKDDRSSLDALKINIKNDLKKRGVDTKNFDNRLGKKFYLED